jgi:RNA polymerase sigma-70 factor, ECF subfamily
MTEEDLPPFAADDAWLELIRRAAEGDRGAEDDLLAQIRPFLKSFLLKKYGQERLGNEDMSDVVNDCLLSIFLNKDQFHGTTKAEVIGWMRRIAVNEAKDALRDAHAQKRDVSRQAPLPHDSSGGVPLAAAGPSPSQEAIGRELETRYQAIRAGLGPDEQQVLMLRDEQNCDWPEIASAMGKSEAAVQKQYFRAVRRLRQRLEETS